MDVERAVQDIAETVSNCVAGIGLELEVDDSVPGSPVEEVVTCRVTLSGACEGEVIVTSGAGFARELAAKMCEIDAAELSPDAIRDALGELTHVIGGNVKALFRGSTKLSLPSLMLGPASPRSERDAATMRSVRLASREKPFVVTVLARGPANR